MPLKLESTLFFLQQNKGYESRQLDCCNLHYNLSVWIATDCLPDFHNLHYKRIYAGKN